MTQTQKTLKKNEKEVTIPKTLEKTIIHPFQYLNRHLYLQTVLWVLRQ